MQTPTGLSSMIETRQALVVYKTGRNYRGGQGSEVDGELGASPVSVGWLSPSTPAGAGPAVEAGNHQI